MSALKDRNGTQKTRNPYFIGAPHKIALYRRIIVLIKRMQQVSCSEKSLRERSGVHGGLVPVVGLEPTRYRYQRILSAWPTYFHRSTPQSSVAPRHCNYKLFTVAS